MNKKDQEHEEKLTKIMANASSLKGKEYIDYLLAFLKGKKDESADASKKTKQICFHELTKDECTKLTEILADENMVYYFNVNGGMSILVDSLYISTTGLKLIQKVLENNEKLKDDFQREHLYEGLIDLI